MRSQCPMVRSLVSWCGLVCRNADGLSTSALTPECMACLASYNIIRLPLLQQPAPSAKLASQTHPEAQKLSGCIRQSLTSILQAWWGQRSPQRMVKIPRQTWTKRRYIDCVRPMPRTLTPPCAMCALASTSHQSPMSTPLSMSSGSAI